MPIDLAVLDEMEKKLRKLGSSLKAERCAVNRQLIAHATLIEAQNALSLFEEQGLPPNWYQWDVAKDDALRLLQHEPYPGNDASKFETECY